jgi:peptide/nickel transport system substrate-binding protein
MKTRTIYFLFALLVIFSLVIAACSPSAPATEEPPPTTVEEVAPEEPAEPAETEEPMEEPTEEVVEEPTEEPVVPNVLKVANTANITTWDPIKSFSTEAAYMANIYEQLMRINPPNAEERFTPLLAESWETNEDGTVWTFHLREGVTFHDGEPLTAEAVKLSLEAAAERAGASFIWWALDHVEVVDDLTVEIHMTGSMPVDLIASSLYAAWIISPKALEAAAADENYFEAGVDGGTGPYTIESYIPDQEILLTRYDDYWGGWTEGQFDKVLIQIVGEDVLQQQMLEGGEVDLTSRLPQENYDTFRDDPNYTVFDEPTYFNYVGYFNTLRPPLDNKLVRQALSYAIPYEDIITIGANGLATQSRGPVPQGVWPWSEDVPQYTYDLDKARELLAEAGYPDGGFTIKLTYAAENNTEAAFAPLIKDSFAEIGVEVELEAIPFNQQWELAKADPPNAQDMFLVLYWPTYSDAGSDNLWSLFYYTEAPFFNLSYWNNPDYNATLDEAIGLTVTDPETSQAKYIEAMNLLVEEAPGIFFMDTMQPLVIPNYLSGYQYNLNYPFVYHFYNELSN